MTGYQPPAYHPGIASSHQMGSLSSMTAGDWGYLLGGAVVGGIGVNGLIGNFRGARIRPNAVSILVNLVLAGVGLTLFVDKGGKMIAKAPAPAA